MKEHNNCTWTYRYIIYTSISHIHMKELWILQVYITNTRVSLSFLTHNHQLCPFIPFYIIFFLSCARALSIYTSYSSRIPLETYLSHSLFHLYPVFFSLFIYTFFSFLPSVLMQRCNWCHFYFTYMKNLYH